MKKNLFALAVMSILCLGCSVSARANVAAGDHVYAYRCDGFTEMCQITWDTGGSWTVTWDQLIEIENWTEYF